MCSTSASTAIWGSGTIRRPARVLGGPHRAPGHFHHRLADVDPAAQDVDPIVPSEAEQLAGPEAPEGAEVDDGPEGGVDGVGQLVTSAVLRNRISRRSIRGA